MYLSHSLSLSACVCSVHTRYIQKYKSCAVPIRHQFLSALGKAIYFLFTCVYAFQSTGKCSFYWFRVSLEQIFSKWFYFVRITSGEWNGEWGRYHEKRKRKKKSAATTERTVAEIVKRFTYAKRCALVCGCVEIGPSHMWYLCWCMHAPYRDIYIGYGMYNSAIKLHRVAI